MNHLLPASLTTRPESLELYLFVFQLVVERHTVLFRQMYLVCLL